MRARPRASAPHYRSGGVPHPGARRCREPRPRRRRGKRLPKSSPTCSATSKPQASCDRKSPSPKSHSRCRRPLSSRRSFRIPASRQKEVVAPAAKSPRLALRERIAKKSAPLTDKTAAVLSCKGRSKFRPLRRHKMQASSNDGFKGQKVLSTCLVWDFSGTRSGPVTAAVAGFSSAAWPEFGPPYTVAALALRKRCAEVEVVDTSRKWTAHANLENRCQKRKPKPSAIETSTITAPAKTTAVPTAATPAITAATAQPPRHPSAKAGVVTERTVKRTVADLIVRPIAACMFHPCFCAKTV